MTFFSYLVTALGVGVLVGTFSGLFGVGGGILMVPAFVYIFSKETHHAMATSLAAMIPMALAGCARYASATPSETPDYRVPIIIAVAFLIIGSLLVKYAPEGGWVDFRLATAMAVGSVIGGFFLGVPLALAIKGALLRQLFGVLILVVSLRMIGVDRWVSEHLLRRFAG